jgi:hypothetical protein
MIGHKKQKNTWSGEAVKQRSEIGMDGQDKQDL